MSQVLYLADAYDVGGYDQGGCLYLVVLSDGRLVGYSDEFELVTIDIAKACDAEQHSAPVWLGWLPGEPQPEMRPATLVELQAQDLDKYLVGWKRTYGVKEEINGMTIFPS